MTLDASKQYHIYLTISSSSGSGFASYAISQNLPPYAGRCSVSPPQGTLILNIVDTQL
jgi:hypothetical protein